jgi:hypothetical protein
MNKLVLKERKIDLRLRVGDRLRYAGAIERIMSA